MQQTIMSKFIVTTTPTVHGLLKFPSDEGIIIVHTTTMGPPKCSHFVQPNVAKPIIEEGSAYENTKGVVINEKYKEQKIKIGAELPKGLQEGLTALLK